MTTIISPAADTALWHLRSNGRPSGSAHFPKDYSSKKDIFRHSKSTDTHTWFTNIARHIPDIESTYLNNQLAFFGSIEWSENIITKCSLQAIITKDTTLKEYINKTETGIQYYRLDYDTQNTGRLFKEPIPHIHTAPNGEPRFNINKNEDTFIPTSFLEIIYLNHFYEQEWALWAERAIDNENCNNKFPKYILKDDLPYDLYLKKSNELNPELEKLKNILYKIKNQHADHEPKLCKNLKNFNYEP